MDSSPVVALACVGGEAGCALPPGPSGGVPDEGAHRPENSSEKKSIDKSRYLKIAIIHVNTLVHNSNVFENCVCASVQEGEGMQLALAEESQLVSSGVAA